MSNPSLALWLYLAIIMVNVAFSKAWQRFWVIISTGIEDKTEGGQ